MKNIHQAVTNCELQCRICAVSFAGFSHRSSVLSDMNALPCLSADREICNNYLQVTITPGSHNPKAIGLYSARNPAGLGRFKLQIYAGTGENRQVVSATTQLELLAVNIFKF